MSVINVKKVTTPYGTEDECLEIITDIQSDGYRLNDVIDLPGTYTFSIWHKSTSASTLSFSILGNAENIQSTNEWKKYVKTVEVTKENIGANNKIDIIPLLNKAVYLYEGYLVQGTADTSWLPAPEDIDENISSVKSEFIQKANEISMKVTDLDGNMTLISQDIKTIKSSVKDAEGNISEIQQEVGKIQNTVKDVEGNVSDVTQKVDSVTAEVKNARGDKSSLSVRIDGINTRVESADGKISQLEQDANSFEISVGQRFDNLQVGGRNIALGTGIEKYGRNCDYKVAPIIFENGDYVVSFYAKANKSSKVNVYLNDDTGENRISITFASNISISTSYKKYVFVGKLNKEYSGANNNIVMRIYGVTENDTSIYVKQLMLEKGNKATDWTPAPEDTKGYKYLTTNYSYTQSSLETYAKDTYSGNWVVNEGTSGINVGDTVAMKVGNTTSGGYVHIVGVVTAIVNATTITVKSQNMIDYKVGGIANDVKNNLANNYYTKTQTDAQFKVTSDSITSTVTKIDNLKVSNRNILLKSNEETTNTNYLLKAFVSSVEVKANTEYTVVVCFKIKAGHRLYVYPGQTSNSGGFLDSTGEDKQIEYLQFTSKPNEIVRPNDVRFYNWAANNEGDGTEGTLYWACLYEGTIRPSLDWTPAPEDLAPYEALGKAESALETATNAETTINNQLTKINQTYDAIKMLVVDDKGGTLLDQTTEGWQFNIGSIPGAIEDIKGTVKDNTTDIATNDKLIGELDTLTKDIEKKTAHINITTYNGQPALVLGQSNSSFKLRITNTSIDFLDGSTTVAYISNKILYIEKAIVKNEFQIGEGIGLVFKKRANGNVGYRWVKG